jgi:hypothetical protein
LVEAGFIGAAAKRKSRAIRENAAGTVAISEISFGICSKLAQNSILNAEDTGDAKLR